MGKLTLPERHILHRCVEYHKKNRNYIITMQVSVISLISSMLSSTKKPLVVKIAQRYLNIVRSWIHFPLNLILTQAQIINPLKKKNCIYFLGISKVSISIIPICTLQPSMVCLVGLDTVIAIQSCIQYRSTRC